MSGANTDSILFREVCVALEKHRSTTCIEGITSFLSAQNKAKLPLIAAVLHGSFAALYIPPIELSSSSISQAQEFAGPPSDNTDSVLDLDTVKSLIGTLASTPMPMAHAALLGTEFKKSSQIERDYLSSMLSGNQSDFLSAEEILSAISEVLELDFTLLWRAFLRCSDISKVVKQAVASELEAIEMEPFHSMVDRDLAQSAATSDKLPEFAQTWIENWPDGMEFQIHKQGEQVEIYSESGIKSVHLFPEIAKAARLVPQNFIADAHVVAWANERPLPLSHLESRLRRETNDFLGGEETAVIAWISDLLWFNGEDLTNLPLLDRNKPLTHFTVNSGVRIATHTLLESEDQISGLVEKAASQGQRGIIAKDRNAVYEWDRSQRRATYYSSEMTKSAEIK